MVCTEQLSFPVTPDRVVHLSQDLGMDVLEVDGGYWDQRANHPELADGRVLSVFDYRDTWTWWERHPVGDELAYLLAGSVEVLLDDGSGHASVGLSPGRCAIIP